MWGCPCVSLGIVTYCLVCDFCHLEFGETVTRLLVLNGAPPEETPAPLCRPVGTDCIIREILVRLVRSVQMRTLLSVLTARKAIYDTPMRTHWKILFPYQLTRGASSTQDGEARQRTKHHLIVFPSLVEFPFERLYPKIISQTTYHNQHKNTQILVLIRPPYQDKRWTLLCAGKAK